MVLVFTIFFCIDPIIIGSPILFRSPPVALQPSLGHYFARVNQQWRKGYEVKTTRTGHFVSDPVLSHVVVVSISGGYHDYQVLVSLHLLFSRVGNPPESLPN